MVLQLSVWGNIRSIRCNNNVTYDHNAIPTATGVDPIPQNFTVSYTPVQQTANLIVEGKTVETVTGGSDSKISFNATDKDLHKSGYDYEVSAPDGKSYGSLAEALKAVPNYDHNDLTNGLDATPQNFTVVYTKNKDKENPSIPHDKDQQGSNKHVSGQKFGSFGERIEQYGLLGAILLAIPTLIFLGLKKLKKKA
ncbi:MAG: hypothetical protein ACTH5F_05130 [Pseudolactococcus laudensis]